MTGIVQSLIGSFGSVVSAATDAYFYLVTLLLPGNGTNGAQNNTFLDSSTNNFTITRNGNTTQGTFSPFSQTGWSAYFDGNSDNIATPSNSAFDPSGQNVTVDFFIYLTRYANANNIVFEVGNASTGDLQCNIVNTGEVRFTIGGSTGSTISGFTLNTWHYITCVKSGTSFTVYLNAVAGTTATLSPNSKTTMYIGGQSSNVNNIDGYISNFRYVRGSANVPSGVPTSPLTAITNTSLLTFQSNRFIDNSSNAFALTVNGNVSIQPFSPFAPTAAYSAATVGGSGYFDGTGDYLSIADATALDLESSDFCIEVWVYQGGTTATNGMRVVNKYTYSTRDIGYFLDVNQASAPKVRFAAYNSSGAAVISFTSTSTELKANQWNHIAVMRSGANAGLFINGVRVSNSTTVSGTIENTTQQLCIGSENGVANTFYTGYISGVRIVKGSAVYDPTLTTLTVPTAPPTAIANTSLLCNFTNAGITDATAKNALETVGNAQISTTQSKFGGSSMYFDGTGDYLLVPDGANIAFGSGNFTVEAWVYPAASPNQAFIVGQWSGSTGSTTLSWCLIMSNDANRNLRFALSSDGSNVLTDTVSSSALTLNAWNHVALVRNGNVFTAYLNGTAATGGTYTITAGTALYDATNQLSIGSTSAGGQNFNGYIDDLRITKGYARYTANFTPPTAAFALQ